MITHSQAPLNILLLEDDDGDARALQRAFQKAGIENTIIRAVDGIEALDMLRGTNGKAKIMLPYLLLVDLNMPRMNGIQFIKALREDEELHPSIVFVLTTSKSDEDRVAAYHFNVAGYITKDKVAQDFLSLVTLVGIYERNVEFP
ncbi:Two-component response regulator [Acidisarcina polymorpha]|uniref:Two-component response regulator n=1 Tax=Acidisarcina polymorpha TaxID=2211140 RepID=A0A2Z5FWZ6_9BACT|nr:response regulator [Acidisarcina polymorpha]AXC11398.1 Two-component response regulator [Acidisarcina polymorpha]